MLESGTDPASYIAEYTLVYEDKTRTEPPVRVSSTPTAAGFLFFTLVTGPRRSLSQKPSDARVYQPQIRAGFAAHCSPASLGLTDRFHSKI